MKNYLLIPASLLLASGFAHAAPVHPKPFLPTRPALADSIGQETKDGKRFILHRVDQGQTLYAIARRYGRSVADIKLANPDMNESVRYDQIVRVPVANDAPARRETKAIDKPGRAEKPAGQEPKTDSPANATTTAPAEKSSKKPEDPARAGIHVVGPRQTLYSLAVRYEVPQADIRKWNNLANDNILIGQALIVSEKAYQARMPATTTTTPTADPKPAETAKPTETPVRPAPGKTTDTKSTSATRPDPKPDRPVPRPSDEPVTAPRPDANTSTPPERTDRSATPKPAEAEIILPRAGNDAPMPARGRRVSSSGVAEMIEGADGSGKYLALHRTAPIGTLVQVSNKFNNQSLWVKVVGRLPNTGVNDKILIKLSAQAFAKLSPDDRRFRAEVSYIVR